MLRALSLSPLVVFPAILLAVLIAFIFEVIKTGSIPSNTASEFNAAIIYAGIAPLVSYPATLLVGVPIYLLLKKFYRITLLSLSVASLVPAAAFSLFALDIVVFLSVGYFSLWVAVAFWWLLPKNAKQSEEKM